MSAAAQINWDDDSTNVPQVRWDDEPAAATPPTTSKTAEPSKPSTYEKLTRGYNPDVEQWAEKHPIAGPVVRGLDAAGGAAMSLPGSIASSVAHPIDTAKGMFENLGDWAKPETWKAAPSVLPEALGQGVGTYTGGDVLGETPKAALNALPEGISKMALPARERIAGVMRNPETGKLKPRVAGAASVTGGVLGAVKGGPYGFLGGALTGPRIADILTPDLSEDALREGKITRGMKNAQIQQAVKDRMAPPPAELGTPENPAWHAKLPTRMPPAPEPIDPLAQAVREGRAAKLPTRISPPPEPTDPLVQAVREGRASKIPTRMPAPPLEVDPLTEAVREGRAVRLPTRMPPAKATLTPSGKITFNVDVPERQAAIPRSITATPAQEFATRQAAAPEPSRITGSAQEPFEPLIYESPQEAAQIDQRNANLKRQASAAGTYHAAQGAVKKKLNLQQRIERQRLGPLD